MKFSGKMWLLIIIKVTKKQGFSVSLKNFFLEKPQRGDQIDPSPSPFRVKSLLQFSLKLIVIVYG